MKFLKGALCGALVMLLAVSFVSCRPGFPGSGRTKAVSSETESKLKEMEALIQDEYFGEVEEDSLQTGIYAGYVAGLGDPYSVYYDEEATRALRESTPGEYDGIGAIMSLASDTGIITIAQVYKGSPAEEAGLKDGDVLHKVDGQEVAGRDLADVVGDIKGKRGTEVDLTVLRGDDAREITVTATRDTVEYPTVESEMLADQIGYIRVLEFDSVTYDQYMNAFEELMAQGMQRLIVDLRGNPGGGLQTVCDILDEILPEGLIVQTEDKNGSRREIESDGERQIDMPLVVLVNESSASASEIFAGAVQDYGIGKIVGATTYGKGVVQEIFELKDGTCVKLTVSEYFTPKGRSINKTGIEPDVEVGYEADESDPEADNQLDAAVEAVKKE